MLFEYSMGKESYNINAVILYKKSISCKSRGEQILQEPVKR